MSRPCYNVLVKSKQAKRLRFGGSNSAAMGGVAASQVAGFAHAQHEKLKGTGPEGTDLREQTESLMQIFEEDRRFPWIDPSARRSEELKKAVAVSERENPAAFPKARPIFQQPFSLPESAQTLAGIAFRAAGKIGEEFSSSVEICRKTFPARNFGQPQPSRDFWFKGSAWLRRGKTAFLEEHRRNRITK